MNQLKSQILHLLSHPFAWVSAGLIPSILALVYVVSSEKNFDHMQEKALYLKSKKEWSQKRQKRQEAFLSQLKIANHDYLEKEIESMQLLSNEVQKLQALIHSEPTNIHHQTRLEYLRSGQNNLRFKEQNFQRVDHFQEVEAIAEHPVEMNERDLTALLAKIENVEIGQFHPGTHPPDLLIRKFELSKKPLTSNEELFILHLELIKREYIE